MSKKNNYKSSEEINKTEKQFLLSFMPAYGNSVHSPIIYKLISAETLDEAKEFFQEYITGVVGNLPQNNNVESREYIGKQIALSIETIANHNL